MNFSKKASGCYWGLALGDALGKPVEFSDIYTIKERYGDEGILEVPRDAIWTDDTEMTIAVTRALLDLGNAESIEGIKDDIIGQAFARAFIEWFDNPGHAPGNTCMRSVVWLKDRGPDSWKSAGRNTSKGCGTVMRAAPVGLWFAKVIAPELDQGIGKMHELIASVSRIQSQMTHGNPAATVSALAGSYAVALASNDINPEDIPPKIFAFCSNINADFDKAMKRLENALNEAGRRDEVNDVDMLHKIGRGWVGEEAIAMALYTIARNPADIIACLRCAVNHDGDSDSVGCIAGSILGAYLGIDAIPKDWIDRLMEKSRLDHLIKEVETLLA